jgi:hypothetical protein
VDLSSVPLLVAPPIEDVKETSPASFTPVDVYISNSAKGGSDHKRKTRKRERDSEERVEEISFNKVQYEKKGNNMIYDSDGDKNKDYIEPGRRSDKDMRNEGEIGSIEGDIEEVEYSKVVYRYSHTPYIY